MDNKLKNGRTIHPICIFNYLQLNVPSQKITENFILLTKKQEGFKICKQHLRKTSAQVFQKSFIYSPSSIDLYRSFLVDDVVTTMSDLSVNE